MSRERIKEAALKHFSEKGFGGASISQITKDVNMTKPAVYYFFKNKEDLYLELVSDCFHQHLAYMKKLQEEIESGHEVSFTRLLQQMVEYHSTYRTETLFLNGANLFPHEPFKSEIRRRFMEHEHKLIQLIKAVLISESSGRLEGEKLDEWVDFGLCLMDGVFIEIFYYDAEQFVKKFERITQVLESTLRSL